MKRLKALFFNLAICSFIFVCVFPLFILALWSVTKRWTWPNLIPEEFSLRSITYLVSIGNDSFKILCFSVCLSLAVTVLTLLLSIPAGKALGTYKFKGKQFFRLALLSPLIIPTAAMAMGVQVAFLKWGLAGTILGVVIIHLIPCLPYGILMLSDVFEIIGEKLELQARVLGASGVQSFRYVTLPLIAPGLLSAGSLIFIVSFSQYFLTFLIGGGNVMTFSMVMVPFIQSGDRAMASSYSVVFIVTTLLLLALMEKAIKKQYKTEKHFYI